MSEIFRGKKYRVHYSGGKDFYLHAKDFYREGERVEVILTMIATDTDYSFSVDGANAEVSWVNEGYKISFIMPAHEVTVRCVMRNTMECLSSPAWEMPAE